MLPRTSSGRCNAADGCEMTEQAGQSSEPKPNQEVRSRGLYISRGMSLRLPPGGLKIRIGEDGSLEVVEGPAFEVSLDTHSYWLDIAWSNLERSRSAHQRLLAVWNTRDERRKARALEAEFAASLQSMVAVAVALDAFYAAVRPHITIPQATLTAWRKRRTARHAQIAEVLRRSFLFGPKTGALIRNGLKELFAWRDRSVHPSAEAARPIAYPELGVGTEWRLVAYRHENAQRAMSFALSLIAQLLAAPKPNLREIARYCEGALPPAMQMVRKWERRYGQLYPREKRNGKKKAKARAPRSRP
jgi:hypothetical protein